jgi:hypothetical protein
LPTLLLLLMRLPALRDSASWLLQQLLLLDRGLFGPCLQQQHCLWHQLHQQLLTAARPLSHTSAAHLLLMWLDQQRQQHRNQSRHLRHQQQHLLMPLAQQTAVLTLPSPLLVLLKLLCRLLLQRQCAGLGPQAELQADLVQQQGLGPWQLGQQGSGLLPKQGPMLLLQQRPRAAAAAP